VSANPLQNCIYSKRQLQREDPIVRNAKLYLPFGMPSNSFLISSLQKTCDRKAVKNLIGYTRDGTNIYLNNLLTKTKFCNIEKNSLKVVLSESNHKFNGSCLKYIFVNIAYIQCPGTNASRYRCSATVMNIRKQMTEPTLGTCPHPTKCHPSTRAQFQITEWRDGV